MSLDCWLLVLACMEPEFTLALWQSWFRQLVLFESWTLVLPAPAFLTPFPQKPLLTEALACLMAKPTKTVSLWFTGWLPFYLFHLPWVHIQIFFRLLQPAFSTHLNSEITLRGSTCFNLPRGRAFHFFFLKKLFAFHKTSHCKNFFLVIFF